MLDPNLGELARVRILAALEKLDTIFWFEMSRASIATTLGASNRPQGSSDKTLEVRTQYLERRVERVWEAIKQVFAAGRVQYSVTLAADLKAEVRKYAAPADARAGIHVAGLLERPLRQADSDIDLYVLGLMQHAESQSPQPQSLVFNAPVGAVQTGAGSTAYVEQHISQGEREALLQALDMVRNELGRTTEWTGPPTEQVFELIEECQAEVQKARPNLLRIGAVATALATTIQAVGSMPGAYQALQAALAKFGIHV